MAKLIICIYFLTLYLYYINTEKRFILILFITYCILCIFVIVFKMAYSPFYEPTELGNLIRFLLGDICYYSRHDFLIHSDVKIILTYCEPGRFITPNGFFDSQKFLFELHNNFSFKKLCIENMTVDQLNRYGLISHNTWSIFDNIFFKEIYKTFNELNSCFTNDFQRILYYSFIILVIFRF